MDTGKHGWREGGRARGREKEGWWMAEWTEGKVNGLEERGEEGREGLRMAGLCKDGNMTR